MGPKVSSIFCSWRPNKGEVIGSSSTDSYTWGDRCTDSMLFALGSVTDNCDKAVGYGARAHIQTHTYAHIYTYGLNTTQWNMTLHINTHRSSISMGKFPPLHRYSLIYTSPLLHLGEITPPGPHTRGSLSTSLGQISSGAPLTVAAAHCCAQLCK